MVLVTRCGTAWFCSSNSCEKKCVYQIVSALKSVIKGEKEKRRAKILAQNFSVSSSVGATSCPFQFVPGLRSTKLPRTFQTVHKASLLAPLSKKTLQASLYMSSIIWWRQSSQRKGRSRSSLGQVQAPKTRSISHPV